ncbi:cyclin-like protein [Dipodascopsis tothii]|uniref:cyclin-like protein n=1 Tax=Dipodascopsis tothii TaxID=44089 RepID=UPI0034CE1C58
MAANYWVSSQRKHWQFSRQQLSEAQAATELETGYKCADLCEARHLRIYLHSLIQTLGRHLSVRQQALATAEVYLARFYLRTAVQESNVYVVVATCIYVACKIEESPQHIRTVVSEARSLWPDFITHDPTKLAECEFYLIEQLDAYLVVHHPYRSLVQLSKALGASGHNAGLSADEMQCAWSILNDSYITDVPLMQAPHVIAMSAMYLSIVLRTPHMSGAQTDRAKSRMQKIIDWFASSGVELEQVIDCAQEMISLYESWESYNEKLVREAVARTINTKK